MGVFLELLKTELSDAHDCSAKSAGFASPLLLCFGWGSLSQQVRAFWRFWDVQCVSNWDDGVGHHNRCTNGGVARLLMPILRRKAVEYASA